MPRWLAHALVVLGWLLTPAWAWAASQVGLWLATLVALRFQSPIAMLAIAGAGALLVGFAVLWAWIKLMRRLPHLLSHRMAPRDSAEIPTGAGPGEGGGGGGGPHTTPEKGSGTRAATRPTHTGEHAAIAAAD